MPAHKFYVAHFWENPWRLHKQLIRTNSSDMFAICGVRVIFFSNILYLRIADAIVPARKQIYNLPSAKHWEMQRMEKSNKRVKVFRMIDDAYTKLFEEWESLTSLYILLCSCISIYWKICKYHARNIRIRIKLEKYFKWN